MRSSAAATHGNAVSHQTPSPPKQSHSHHPYSTRPRHTEDDHYDLTTTHRVAATVSPSTAPTTTTLVLYRSGLGHYRRCSTTPGSGALTESTGTSSVSEPSTTTPSRARRRRGRLSHHLRRRLLALPATKAVVAAGGITPIPSTSSDHYHYYPHGIAPTNKPGRRVGGP